MRCKFIMLVNDISDNLITSFDEAWAKCIENIENNEIVVKRFNFSDLVGFQQILIFLYDYACYDKIVFICNLATLDRLSKVDKSEIFSCSIAEVWMINWPKKMDNVILIDTERCKIFKTIPEMIEAAKSIGIEQQKNRGGKDENKNKTG